MVFFAHFDIDIKCKHIAGVNNSTAEHLSHGNLHSLFCLKPQANHQPTPLPQPLLQIWRARLDITLIQAAVQHCFENGLASSIQRCYNARQQSYVQFYKKVSVILIPTTKHTMSLFAAHLALQGITHSTIKVYFSSICNLHLSCSQHSIHTAKIQVLV